MTRDEEKRLLQQIRCLTNNVYDMQKCRIMMGNRLVQSKLIQAGIDPATKKDELPAEYQDLLSRLRKEHKTISEYMVENNYTVKKALKTMGTDAKALIHTELDYSLINTYETLVKEEKAATKVVANYVHEHPMWDAFFKDVKGCGEMMAAVCLSYLNIDIARNPSCFWAYAGLDAVQDKDKDGELLYYAEDGGVVRQQFYYKDIITGDTIRSDKAVEPNENGVCVIDGTDCTKEYVDGVYEYIDDPTREYKGRVRNKEHGRRMGDTVMREYVDKSGNKQMKKSITYNPDLKTKLMGVLSGCIIKVGQRFGENIYEQAYRDYKRRLDNSPRRADLSDGHVNTMAQRYMIKQFLRDLWATWRKYEGYEIRLPYEVEFLGRKPHKYNEYVSRLAGYTGDIDNNPERI